MPPAVFNDSQVRAIPLAEADPAAIDTLFEEQRSEWMERLRWDYAAPSKILRELVVRRELLGFAAVAGSATIGFSFYVVEGARCSIGDIYVSKDWRRIGADGKMASAILGSVRRMPRMRRIECQGPAFDNDAADGVFLGLGFARYDRHFMLASLADIDWSERSGNTSSRAASAAEVTLRPWNETDFGPAVRVIYRSYNGRIDRDINILYTTEEGCAELLSILTDSVWCGKFLPDVSCVAANAKTGVPVGVLVASGIASDVGHIGQVSVTPSHQGLGVGRRMIQLALTQLKLRGDAAASLAVTGQNTSALGLYRSIGFQTIHTFPVYCWRLK